MWTSQKRNKILYSLLARHLRCTSTAEVGRKGKEARGEEVKSSAPSVTYLLRAPQQDFPNSISNPPAQEEAPFQTCESHKSLLSTSYLPV